MDDRHVDFSLEDLHERQRDIDGIIDSLLNFAPSTKNQQKRKSIENVAGGATSVISNSPLSSSQVKKEEADRLK